MNSAPRLTPATTIPLQPNQPYLAMIVHAQRNGLGCLPESLGLAETDQTQLLQRYFSAGDLPTMSDLTRERSVLRQELLEMRHDEWQELHDLLDNHRRGIDESERWLAAMVATACLGSEHLWRDLGLASRDVLKNLLLDNFPELARRNDKDMRWKKFFYKQLCEQQGGYVCRAPSCDQCPTYDDCFGDES